MRRILMTSAACLGLTGCFIGSGNYGWDLGPQIDRASGVEMPQAWRGVHGGRIGFRCRQGQVLLFVETWHPLAVPDGQSVPMQMAFDFMASPVSEQQRVLGVGTARGIEIPAPQVGEGAPGPLLAGLSNDSDEMSVTLPGERHQVNILFEVDHAGHAHEHVAAPCRREAAAA